MKTHTRRRTALRLAAAAFGLVLSMGAVAKDAQLLNVSYDPTRELYRDFHDAQRVRGQEKF